jgi:hypothetical protein
VGQRTQFWSNGGGVQSAAIAVLILQGKLPRPDLIAIADTERERSSVWKYFDEVVQPALQSAGLTMERVLKSEFAHEDLWEDWGNKNELQLLMPAFIANSDGSTGRLRTLCSSRWKRRVMQRWLRSKGVEQCDAWIGFSVDEMRRVRTSDEKWYQFRYPLIFDMPMRRGECIRLVEEYGWPSPPRSACYMCPNRVDSEWRDMKVNWPADFAKAVEVERDIWKLRPDFFLHRSLKPLDQVDFDSRQLSMISGDGSDPNSCTEGCFT